MVPPRFAASLIAPALMLAPIASGCSGDRPASIQLIPYSADALAAEFLAAYKDMKAHPGGPQGPAGPRPRPEEASKSATKAEAGTAPAVTLDDLIADARRKAEGVPDMSPDEALRKVADAVAKDPSIPEADKKAIADKLGKAGG